MDRKPLGAQCLDVWVGNSAPALIYGFYSLRRSFSAREGKDDTHSAGLVGVLWGFKSHGKGSRGHQGKRPGVLASLDRTLRP